MTWRTAILLALAALGARQALAGDLVLPWGPGGYLIVPRDPAAPTTTVAPWGAGVIILPAQPSAPPTTIEPFAPGWRIDGPPPDPAIPPGGG